MTERKPGPGLFDIPTDELKRMQRSDALLERAPPAHSLIPVPGLAQPTVVHTAQQLQDTLAPLAELTVREDAHAQGFADLMQSCALALARHPDASFELVPPDDPRLQRDTEAVPAPRPINELSDPEVLAELHERIEAAGAVHERRILLYLVRRYFGLGLRDYGPVQASDARDPLLDANEKLADLMFYIGWHAIRSGV